MFGAAQGQLGPSGRTGDVTEPQIPNVPPLRAHPRPQPHAWVRQWSWEHQDKHQPCAGEGLSPLEWRGSALGSHPKLRGTVQEAAPGMSHCRCPHPAATTTTPLGSPAREFCLQHLAVSCQLPVHRPARGHCCPSAPAPSSPVAYPSSGPAAPRASLPWDCGTALSPRPPRGLATGSVGRDPRPRTPGYPPAEAEDPAPRVPAPRAPAVPRQPCRADSSI